MAAPHATPTAGPAGADPTDTVRPGAILVLGVMAGHRYPAVFPAAARRGLAVLGVDNLNPRNASVDAARRRDPGHPLARLAEVAWIPDEQPDDVLGQVIAWSQRYAITAVVVFGEPYVEVAATVADCLGLRGPGRRASRVCRNKLLQRRYLAPWSPPSRLVAAEHRDAQVAEWRTFPAIVKPIGRTASSGVQRADDPAGLRAALDALAPMEPALVEAFIDGPELSVETLVADRRIVFAAPTAKITNEMDGTHFVEMGHTVPDPRLSPAAVAAVLAANAEILARLDFVDGAAHAEYRIDSTGAVILMEIAARPAGDAIFPLYHLATGAPLEETLVAILLGEPAAHPVPRRHARQVYLPHRPGILRGVYADGLGVPVGGLAGHPTWPTLRALEPDAPAAIHMVITGRTIGAALGAIRESADRSITFVIDAPTLAELDSFEALCRGAIRIDVEPLPAAVPAEPVAVG